MKQITMMKSFLAKPLESGRQWFLVDATDLVLGRMAAHVAAYLRGKHKPTFTPNVDTGDHVIIINADKVRVTSNKLLTKVRYRHSHYPGGLKKIRWVARWRRIRLRRYVMS